MLISACTKTAGSFYGNLCNSLFNPLGAKGTKCCFMIEIGERRNLDNEHQRFVVVFPCTAIIVLKHLP